MADAHAAVCQLLGEGLNQITEHESPWIPLGFLFATMLAPLIGWLIWRGSR